MSVAVLISGCVFRAPEERMSKVGRRFVSTTIKVSGESGNGEFWACLAFGTTACDELMRLGLNEKLAAQGTLKIETFEKNGETRISRTIFCDHVLPLRQPPREKKPRAAKAPAPQQQPTTTTDPPDDLNDDLSDLPF
jgi:hypothetical protein